MADLEKMALQRDRGYLVRLILLLLVALGVGTFMFAGLTGDSFAGCVAKVFVGAPDGPKPGDTGSGEAPSTETPTKQ